MQIPTVSLFSFFSFKMEGYINKGDNLGYELFISFKGTFYHQGLGQKHSCWEIYVSDRDTLHLQCVYIYIGLLIMCGFHESVSVLLSPRSTEYIWVHTFLA